MLEGVVIRWSGLAVLAGAFLAYILFRKEMKKNGYVKAFSEDIFLGCVVFGILGARLFWYLENGFVHFDRFFLFFYDGFETLGGLLAACIFLFVYTKKNYMSFLRTLDCALPQVLLAMAISRLPSALTSWRVILVVGVDFLGYILLEFVYRRYFDDKHRGDAAALALLWIGLSRFFVNVALYGRANMTPIMKWPGICTGILALVLYVFNRKRKMDTKPLVLFDFDGTLMDTQAMVNESYRYLFDKYRTVDDFDDRTQIEVFGANDRKEIARLFQDQDPNELTTEFRSFQENLPALGLVNTMPHALEILMWLKRNGYTVGVVTSRPTENCQYWLKEFDLDQYIDMVMGAEVYKKAKPAPDALRRICYALQMGHDNCVYIGDHARDVRMARRACVYAIGYVTNEKGLKRITKARPNRMIKDLLELQEILQENDHNWTYNLL